MPQIIAVVAAAVNTVFTSIGFAIGISSATAIGAAAGAFTTFALKTVLMVGASRLLSPRAPKAQQSQRQAQTLSLTLGESPREAIFGTACTGGTLLDAFNYGTDNAIEVQVIALADHVCDGIVGYYVNDTYVAWTTQGLQPNYNSKLTIYFVDGTQTSASGALTANAPDSRWTSDDILLGVAHAIVFYEYDEKTWTNGRPSFRFVIRGAKVYDPRLDSTVTGGSGSHRWADPSTYQWSANAALCRYNFQRGIWTRGQLIVGPGRSADEAPPDRVIAAANICDEAVTLKAGGTEPRYRVGGVVRADESWIEVEEAFAAAMAGDLVERSGALFIDPGASKSSVFSFTDAQLLTDQPVTLQGKVSRRELVNTVSAAFVEPARLWQSTSAPLRRSAGDITDDGEVRERSLDLRFVTSQTQAQRIAEIERRRARLQRTASVVLGPAACLLEAGDWVTWTSARYFAGASKVFQITDVSIDENMRVALQLREIAASVYSWTAASDELDALAPAYLAPGALPAATLANFQATAIALTGAGGSSVPAISVTWTPPTDPSIWAITFEWRKQNDANNVMKATHTRPKDGAIVLAGGISSASNYEVRAIPETDPERDETATAWRLVTSTALAAATAGTASSVLWANVSGSGRPADNATRNIVTYSTSAPSFPVDGDIWVDTSATPHKIKVRIGGVWQEGATRNVGLLADRDTVGSPQIVDGSVRNTAAVAAGAGSGTVFATTKGTYALVTAGLTCTGKPLLMVGGASVAIRTISRAYVSILVFDENNAEVYRQLIGMCEKISLNGTGRDYEFIGSGAFSYSMTPSATGHTYQLQIEINAGVGQTVDATYESNNRTFYLQELVR